MTGDSATGDGTTGAIRTGGDTAAEPALRLAGLHKAFAGTVAVDDLDLTVDQGAFLGLVGPNGAGKTTTLSMAVGLLRPDAGTARVLGNDVWSAQQSDGVTQCDRAKELLGVLPDGLALPQRLTGRELLTYLGLLRGMPGGRVAERIDELLLVLDLHRADRTLIADYSTGMRKKIGIAAALLHGPRLLVLDEPFEAVDPVSASTVRAILDGFVDSGGTIVMSSHVMALVEELCDHVAVLADGRLLRTGTLDEVRGGEKLEVAFSHLVGAPTARQGLSWFAS